MLSSIPLAIPSPTQGVWYVGPLPVRAYALCILVGIVVAALIGERRWRARGGPAGTVIDVASWAVPFGIIGGRLYHVVSSPQAYFGRGGDPVRALYIWEGGLGIWGAVLLGGVGAWIGCRRHGVLLPPFGDAVAPGIVLAQAIGRFGNWFNNELYGRATDLPWGLRIYEWDAGAGRAVEDADGNPVLRGTFHPAFAYEALWDVGTFAVLLWADRRWRLGHGRVFALYVLLYTSGRIWIEALRIDPANDVLGLRLNVWTSMVVFLGALTYLIVSARLRPGREDDVRRPGSRGIPPGAGAQSDPGAQATAVRDGEASSAGHAETDHDSPSARAP